MKQTSTHRSVLGAWRDEGGVVSILFALAAFVVIGMAGVAVDYARATDQRTKLARAADAAALAAASARNKTREERERIAHAVAASAYGGVELPPGFAIGVDEVDGGVRVDARMTMPATFTRLLGKDLWPIAVVAEAVTATIVEPTEIALVLDNTGSMRNDMDTLRTVAGEFAANLFASADKNLKMAVVPYGGAVNPGRALSSAHLDRQAQSRWHGYALENQHMAFMSGCGPSGGGGGGGGSPPPPGDRVEPVTPPGPSRPEPPVNRPRGGGDRALLEGAHHRLASLAAELFGITGAAAGQATVTPSTDVPIVGDPITPGPPLRNDGGTSILPTGFVWDGGCSLFTPPRISHFDLFDRIQGTRWKGCVEARPEPFDVTDEPPRASQPDTLFVPYFWPDEPGNRGASNVNNSYLSDTPDPDGWISNGSARAFVRLFKYNKSNTSLIRETGGLTFGPNAACPDEILPLTDDAGAVASRISTLQHWIGGGTVNSEGVMWGWRALSPSAPFTEGAPYGSTRKFLVLMSDGINTLSENGPGPLASDYSAYGFIYRGRSGRFGSSSFADAEAFLDERMRQACRNAKAAGLTIATVLFREPDANISRLMRECASDPKLAFYAADPNSLRKAFGEIGDAISNGLRVSR